MFERDAQATLNFIKDNSDEELTIVGGVAAVAIATGPGALALGAAVAISATYHLGEAIAVIKFLAVLQQTALPLFSFGPDDKQGGCCLARHFVHINWSCVPQALV